MNNKIRINFLALIILIATVFSATNAFSNEKLNIAGDYWCPYNCEPGAEYEGYIVELAKLALAKEGIELIYKLKSWEEAIEDFNNGNVDAVLGANERDLENPELPSIPQAESKTAAFTLTNTAWIFDGYSSLETRTLGLVEAYAYPSQVENYVYTNYLKTPEKFKMANSQNSVKENIKKLLNSETFIYIEDENVVNNYVKANEIANIRHAGNINLLPDKIYIAFSKANPNSNKYAKLVTAAMLELKANGQLSKLKNKYNIKDYNDVAFLSR